MKSYYNQHFIRNGNRFRLLGFQFALGLCCVLGKVVSFIPLYPAPKYKKIIPSLSRHRPYLTGKASQIINKILVIKRFSVLNDAIKFFSTVCTHNVITHRIKLKKHSAHDHHHTHTYPDSPILYRAFFYFLYYSGVFSCLQRVFSLPLFLSCIFSEPSGGFPDNRLCDIHRCSIYDF